MAVQSIHRDRGRLAAPLYPDATTPTPDRSRSSRL